MSEIIKVIFGDFTWIQLFGYFWFFLIGFFIYTLTEVSGRNVNSIATPMKFSLKFWFFDNWRRYLITILCTYVLFRFYTEISGHPLQNFDCIQLGLTGDFAAATIKDRIKAIGGDRQKLMLKMKNEEAKKSEDIKDISNPNNINITINK